MNFPLVISNRRTLNRGASLIEVMIALVLGTLVMFGLVQMFSASRASYQLTEGISRNQEGGRFALDFLQREVRMAGHFGCVGDQSRLFDNDVGFFTLAFAAAAPASVSLADYDALDWPSRFHISIQGYEANGTGPAEAFTLPAAPAAGGGAWTPALPNQLQGLAVPGSDVLVLRYFSPESITIDAISGGPAPTVEFDAASWPLISTGTAPRLFGLSDCTYATVFAADPAAGQLNAIVEAGQVGFRELYQPGQTQLYRAETVAFFVGISQVTGQPSLFRCRGNELSGDCVAEELVEGVENLQLVYGLSDIVRGRPTGNISEIATAADLGDATTSAANRQNWLRVGTVQMGLVMRHTEQRSGGDPRELPYSLLGSEVSAPVDDRRVRTTYETSVALRNRLFGN